MKLLQRIFPGSRILICVFHTIKWMKTVFASALINTDRKFMIMESFKNLLYAKSLTLYEEELLNWIKVIERVEVKPRPGPDGTWVLLSDYFTKNWGSCVDMWTIHERNNLPIGNINTNNHLERAFRSMKNWLRMLHVGLVTTETAVRDLVCWAEQQLQFRYTGARRKIMQISDPNPVLMSLYGEAAKVLTRPGCLKFKEMMEKMLKVEAFMTVEEGGGVKQVFKSVTDTNPEVSKVYQTTEASCGCVWRQHHTSCPCHHMLFLRRHLGLSMFDKAIFGELYHRDLRNRDLERAVEQEVNEDDDGHSEATGVDVDPDGSNNTEDGIDYSDFREKFRIARTRVDWLLNEICQYGKKQFTEAMGALEQLEVRARQGLPLLPPGSQGRRQPAVQPGSGAGEEAKSQTDCGADGEEGSQHAHSTATMGGDETFKKIRFKRTAPRSRGRPSGSGVFIHSF